MPAEANKLCAMPQIWDTIHAVHVRLARWRACSIPVNNNKAINVSLALAEPGRGGGPGCAYSLEENHACTFGSPERNLSGRTPGCA
jgi:hypothetical protein